METSAIVSCSPAPDFQQSVSVSAESPQPKACTVPYNHLIFNPHKDLKKVVEHCKSVYDAVYFISGLSLSVKNMVDQRASAKSIMLQGPNNKNKLKKTLFLDLDETLVHTSFTEDAGFLDSL